MNLEKLVEKFAKQCKWYDFALLKLAVIFFTLFVITAWPTLVVFILGFAWYWYLIISLILSAPLLKKLFSK